jgi:glutamate--cysteine ligase
LDRDATIESLDTLVDFLREGEKPPENWLVGTEHEKVGLRADDHQVVPYEGPRGVRAVLDAVAMQDGWEPIFEDGNPIALSKGRASITLEPGGQLELSGAPLRTIHQTCDEFHTHLTLLKEVCEPLGLEWLGLGINPLYGVAQVPVMPKARYRIMRDYLPMRGSMALDMMFTTATIQANFDYASEADMAEKMRMAMGISPIVSAIFANSSLSEGKSNGFATKRLHIWHHTDPDRCGLLPFVFEPDFGYRQYVEWALDIPMFYLVRDGRYRPVQGVSFRRFLEEGFEGERANLADFERHLTTLFPEVRLKNILEVRGADAVPPGLICSLPALWKGLLYDAEARSAAWDLVAEASFDARVACQADVARRGLAAYYDGVQVLELARALTDLSRAGLARIAHSGRRDPDETCFLDPIFEQLGRGTSPGEDLIGWWEGEWNRSVDRLIEYARY